MIVIKRPLFTWTLLCVLNIVTLCCKSQESEPQAGFDKMARIDSLLRTFHFNDGFHGAALVAHDGEVLFKKGYGLANRSWDIPNTTTTKFQIASLTKPFTAILIMQLVAEERLALDQPISKYLVNYKNTLADSITIHQLLTHTSGLPRDFTNNSNSNQPQVMADDILAMPLAFKPGETFAYSNAGYQLLGYIIETLTDMPYEEALDARIFKPLGMNNSGMFRNRTIIKNMSSGYYKGFGDYYNIEYTDGSTAYAAGSLYSTVEDLWLFDQALNSETLLPRTYRDLLFTKHIIDSATGGHYGYGWELVDKPLGSSGVMAETVGHSGVKNGYCALFTRIPSKNTTIILLNNTRRAYLNTITTAISGIVNDVPFDFPKRSLAKSLTQIIAQKGIASGIAFFNTHKDSPDYYLNESELIVTGYQLLHNNQAQEAAEVFQLSIENFPNKDNPYDSYAEAMMVLGQTEAAIANYKKSLELNPNNRNAVTMLKTLGVEME